ncbi:MAG: hypothetical protein KDA64_12415 [Rhodospirillaceae bacterium]|nr:hypothetical protein [Rhodospirillaceae bacterium]
MSSFRPRLPLRALGAMTDDGAAAGPPPAVGAQVVHATSVAIDGRGVLLRGPSGCGKSELALCLIDAGARLIADDVSLVWADGAAAVVGGPPEQHGCLSLDDVGLLELPAVASAPLALVVDLVPGGPAAAGKPTAGWGEATTAQLAGIRIASFVADPHLPSTSAKIRAVLRRMLPPSGAGEP